MGKICFKCGLSKPLDEFYRHPMMRDGRLGKCKECTKRDVRENYHRHFEHYRQYEQKRFRTDGRRRTVLRCTRLRRKAHPEKTRAYNAIRRAILTGILVRQPCEVCGAKAQAHHSDYSKPFDVRWLCFLHHRMIGHGQLQHLQKDNQS